MGARRHCLGDGAQSRAGPARPVLHRCQERQVAAHDEREQRCLDRHEHPEVDFRSCIPAIAICGRVGATGTTTSICISSTSRIRCAAAAKLVHAAHAWRLGRREHRWCRRTAGRRLLLRQRRRLAAGERLCRRSGRQELPSRLEARRRALARLSIPTNAKYYVDTYSSLTTPPSLSLCTVDGECNAFWKPRSVEHTTCSHRSTWTSTRPTARPSC